MTQVSVVKCENYAEVNVDNAIKEALLAIEGLDTIKEGCDNIDE